MLEKIQERTHAKRNEKDKRRKKSNTTQIKQNEECLGKNGGVW
jgi:hypothetical protein